MLMYWIILIAAFIIVLIGITVSGITIISYDFWDKYLEVVMQYFLMHDKYNFLILIY